MLSSGQQQQLLGKHEKKSGEKGERGRRETLSDSGNLKARGEEEAANILEKRGGRGKGRRLKNREEGKWGGREEGKERQKPRRKRVEESGGNS